MAERARQQEVTPSFAEWVEATPGIFVAGENLLSQSGRTLDVVDPSTGSVLGVIARGDAEDVDRALDAAGIAFADGRWAGLRPSKRSELMNKVGDLIRRHGDELSEIESLDTGKPRRMASGEVWLAAEIFRYYAGWPTKITGETIATNEDLLTYTLREPIGVCAAITPWNVPIINAAFKIAPAIACGNTLVVKPSENASLSTIRLAQLCVEAGIPAGVVNVVTGVGAEAGAALAEHPSVDKISFTGSTAVGRRIIEASAGNIKRVSLELGGKSPSLVLPGADLDRAAKGIFKAVFLNSGQMCTAGAKIVVHASLVDELVDRLATLAGRVRLGPGLDPASTMGPLVSQTQLDRVRGYIEVGTAEGAKLAFGGGRGLDGTDGYFVEPTMFTDTSADMRIVREEIFGPVGVVMTAETVEEAIAIGNDTEYGLAATIWTEDINLAHRVARRIRAGTIWINSYGLLDPAVPMGGYRQSGQGRELGANAIPEYTELKSVWTELAPLDASRSMINEATSEGVGS